MASVHNYEHEKNTVKGIPCKIVGFFGGDTYGKIPLSGAEKQIIAEWKYWLRQFAEHLDPKYSDNNDLVNYLRSDGMQN